MRTEKLSLYVHIPWCTRKCPYCDFNSYLKTAEVNESVYVDALLADLDDEVALAVPETLDSIFFGGGTPSLFSGKALNRLMVGIRDRCAVAPDAEITLEANPGSAEAERFAAYREAGVNRLSLGVQSFDDECLSALGRVHSAEEAHAALRATRALFENFNVDLMYGLPRQAPGGALADLEAALAYAPPHISWYQLTLEAGTAFARSPPELPDAEQIDDDFERGLARLQSAGYGHYEISAHAQAGRRSRHNLNYWCFGDYIGIGAGAHGKRRLEGKVVRRAKMRQPARYLRAALDRSALETAQVVSARELVIEYLLNVLRLRDGFELDAFERATGLSRATPLFAEPLTEALLRGWLEQDGSRIRPTETGFRFVSDIQMLFLDYGEQAVVGQ